MNEMSHETRDLLAAARQGDGLSAADKTRIRSKLTQRIGAGLALGSAVTASATVAEAAHTTFLVTAATWLPGAAKVLGIIALAGTATVGVLRATHPGGHSSVSITAPALRQPTQAPHQDMKKGTVQDLPQSIPSAKAGDSSEDNAPQAERMRAPDRDLTATARHELRNPNGLSTSVESQVAVAQAPPEDGLSNQVAAIREARAAIRRGDGRAALAAIDQGMAHGQGGPLEQEVTLVRVSALCLLGDVVAARRTAEQFLARFPDSLLVSRVRNSCAFGSVTSP